MEQDTAYPRRSLRLLLLLAVLVALTLAGAAFFLLRPEAATPPPAAEPSSTAPATVPSEGALVVGTGSDAVEVPQVPCTAPEDGSFQCDTESTEPVVVSAPPGTLPLEAGVSATFTVSTITLGEGPAAVSFTGGELSFPDAAPGQYSVTVLGEEQDGRRAYWNFVLEVTA